MLQAYTFKAMPVEFLTQLTVDKMLTIQWSLSAGESKKTEDSTISLKMLGVQSGVKEATSISLPHSEAGVFVAFRRWDNILRLIEKMYQL